METKTDVNINLVGFNYSDDNSNEENCSEKANVGCDVNKEKQLSANLYKPPKKRKSTQILFESKRRTVTNWLQSHQDNVPKQAQLRPCVEVDKLLDETVTSCSKGSIQLSERNEKPLTIQNEEYFVPESQSPLLSAHSPTEDIPNNIKNKRCRKDKRWRKEQTYNTVHEALEVVAKEELWSMQSRNGNELGERVYYRCNRIKSKAKQQCVSGLYLLYHNNSDHVTLFRSLNDHNHQDLPGQSHPFIRKTLERVIKNYVDKGLRRKEIMNQLQVDGLTVPSKNQLNSFFAKVRKEIIGRSTIKLNEFQALLKEHSYVPNESNKAFVVAFQCRDDVDTKARFLVSSKKLLSNAIGKHLFVADSKHKILWQGFQVSPIGTVDKDGHFHLIGMGISTNEKEKDFTFFFQSIKTRVMDILNAVVNPSIILCDTSKAISNAFLFVFGANSLVLVCWLHARKNIQKKIGNFFPKKMHKDIIKDINYLQLSNNDEIFESASRLFLAKYAESKEFISYFEYEWLQLNRNWYEGAAQQTPSTNIALELFSRNFKQKRTLRTRLPLSEFASKMFVWIESWSIEYDNGTKRLFADTPTVTLDLWAEGYQWSRLKKVIKKKTDFTGTHMIVPSGDTFQVENKKFVQKTDWKSFEEFKRIFFAAWKVYMKKDDWISSTCTCPAFQKQFLCKHLVGLAIRLQYAMAPVEAKSAKICNKPKRGRPSKAKVAFVTH